MKLPHIKNKATRATVCCFQNLQKKGLKIYEWFSLKESRFHALSWIKFEIALKHARRISYAHSCRARLIMQICQTKTSAKSPSTKKWNSLWRIPTMSSPAIWLSMPILSKERKKQMLYDHTFKSNVEWWTKKAATPKSSSV